MRKWGDRFPDRLLREGDGKEVKRGDIGEAGVEIRR